MAGSSAFSADVQYRKGEVILKLRPPNSTSKVFAAKARQDFFNRISGSHGARVMKSWNDLSLHQVKVDTSSKTEEEVINDFQQMPEVQYAELNYIVKKASVDDQTAQGFSGYTLSQVLSFSGVMTHAQIQYTPTWTMLPTGQPQSVVAVIDTGMDMTHPSLSNAVWVNKGEIASNGIDDDGNGYVDDVHGWNFVYNSNDPSDDEGHGTHVSGIILGVGENIFASPVPAGNVLIMPLKFLDSTGSGATSDAISAIYYASNMGASVINNSWGGGNYSQALAEAITYSYAKNALFVAAAGNSSVDNDTSPSYPASYDMPNVVAVAASDDSDNFAWFSNYGTQSVPLTAPGVSILSTYPGGTFVQMTGTSMASPMVAGVAALMRYTRPAMNVYQIKQFILGGADIKTNLSPYVQTSGRVDALNSVNLSQNTALSSYEPVYNLSLNTADRGLDSSVGGRGTGCGLVSLTGKDFWNNGDPTARVRQIIVVLALLLLPVVLVVGLRQPKTAASRRKYDRYEINSSVTFKFGDKQLVGAVKTISLGGSELNTEALLKDGSTITMFIASPDGSSKIEVQGHVVWSEQQKRYGVQFDEVAEAVKNQISGWQTALKKV